MDLAQSDKTVASGQKISSLVLTLTALYNDLNYHLYMDSWYTSYVLCQQLAKKGWQTCGSLRGNRGGPYSITSKKSCLVKSMNRGNYLFAQSIDSGIFCAT